MPFVYATPTSGPSAGGIGWFDFGSLTINPGQTVPGLTGTLNDGTIVTFDLSLSLVSGAGRPFVATPPPTFPGAQFGTAGYTGMVGNTTLNGATQLLPGTSLFSISNIVVTNPDLSPVPNFTVVIADAERTNNPEQWIWNTDGGNWNLLATLGPNPPALSGIGTQTVTITGIVDGPASAYVATTQAPTQVLLTSVSPVDSRQAFALGFATTRVRLQKNIAGRADAADQFQLNIGGVPSATVTTTGNTDGLQPQVANVFATPAFSYTINESMAPGSVSLLSDYTQVVSASNATPAGSIPPTGNLPITVTPVLGDDITYTITNVAPEAFTKTVDKAYADLGEILTYTVAVENPNNTPVSTVLVMDATPVGTTYIGNIVSSEPYTGTDPATGITFPTIPANTTATLSWQVQVNTVPPLSNPLTNVAMVTVPGGTSGNTNAVTTQVNTAFVTVLKTVDKPFADAGDILTYTLQLNNAGNVAANSVTLTDAVPSGSTFVPGSVTGATGTPPTLTLAAPLAPGGSTTVTFQVQVDNAVPSPNPIPNNSTVNYTYTVDPANPNGATGTRGSNTVTTQANMALVTTTKAVSAAYAELGQVLTYTLVIENTGNVSANNVVITDAIPTGTTFVPGSVTGATGTPPTLTLAAPLAPGGTATVTFQVQVGDTFPVPNPIVNTADTAFTYTVDPADPDGVTGNAPSNPVNTQVNDANITTVKTVDKTISDVGEVLTYTLVLQNSGNVSANNVVITDPVPAGTTFINGSLLGATGTPPTLNVSSIAAGGSATVSYQVLVGDAIPTPNPVPNTASVAFTFTLDPANPDGQIGASTSNTVNTQVNSAIVSATKTADPAFSDVNGTVTYTITLINSGNVAANSVVLTDVIPAGTTFVAGSLVGATGTPPMLTLANPIPAGGSATVTFDVLIGNSLPTPNPLENSVAAAFTYTVDPAQPNVVTGAATGGPAATQVNTAKLVLNKSADKPISYIDDIITYQISVKNTGNVAADNVVLTDLLPTGVSYLPGSLVVSVPYSGSLASGLALTSSIPAEGIVTLSFKTKVDALPNPNPILNKITAAYAYTVDPAAPDAVTATAASNTVSTIVFRYNFSQQISDLIESVALEQAALAAIAQAEGAKIQKMIAMNGVTTQELLCLNKSVSDMMDSLAMLEAVLKQKLNIVNCQINGTGGCM